MWVDLAYLWVAIVSRARVTRARVQHTVYGLSVVGDGIRHIIVGYRGGWC